MLQSIELRGAVSSKMMFHESNESGEITVRGAIVDVSLVASLCPTNHC